MISKLFIFCAVVTMTVTAMSGAEVANKALTEKGLTNERQHQFKR